MRTTLIIDESLLQRARELTGIREKTALVRAGLEALIAREAAKRSHTIDCVRRNEYLSYCLRAVCDRGLHGPDQETFLFDEIARHIRLLA